MEKHDQNAFNNNNNNNNKSLNNSPSPSSPDLSPLSHHSSSNKFQINNNNINNNNNNSIITNKPVPTSATRSSSSASSELSPLSSLDHRSPPHLHNPPPPPSDSPLCHVSPSPPPDRKGGRAVRQSLSVLRAAKREKAVKRAALGVRVFGLGFCLVSLAVMAADKDRGWALDSFYRYKEFRYCISVNVVGFLYSVVQTCDLTFTLCTGKYVLRHQYRLYFDFAMDQMLTYLLMSASSSAATRVDDWESNWGKDEFPMMASISVGLSFMSFVVLAASTLISGYALCTWSSS